MTDDEKAWEKRFQTLKAETGGWNPSNDKYQTHLDSSRAAEHQGARDEDQRDEANGANADEVEARVRATGGAARLVPQDGDGAAEHQAAEGGEQCDDGGATGPTLT